jgi:hypothetical protein
MQEQFVSSGTGIAAGPDCTSFIKLRSVPCRASSTIVLVDLQHVSAARSCGIARRNSTRGRSASERRNDRTRPCATATSSSTTASPSNRRSVRHSSSRQARATDRLEA